MWLTNSSVGRKVVMSVTGLFLVLFVTFHALMNAVALISFEAYDAICEFLGANWYAVLGTLILAGGFAIHIIFAFILTFQNRKARGNNRYAVNARPKNVEWASQNMLVLGIIVLGVMVLHLTQFWAKMQLPELMGEHVMNGTFYLRAIFSQLWVLPVYLIWFAALWFHISHGFWSAFQTLGTANDKWITRWQCISKWWASIVFILFAVEACYFTWFFAL
ncbi:MAG: succinate dehydrogenase cytochrome b subunit [Bacteroidales bacterium]|nr:succinate dehydrogenase cytochrome b subunit [Bacteroidales bacterium]